MSMTFAFDRTFDHAFPFRFNGCISFFLPGCQTEALAATGSRAGSKAELYTTKVYEWLAGKSLDYFG